LSLLAIHVRHLEQVSHHQPFFRREIFMIEKKPKFIVLKIALQIELRFLLLKI